MNDYSQQNQNSVPEYVRIQEMVQQKAESPKTEYPESSNKPSSETKEYTTKKTAFSKIRYVQK